MFSRDSDINVTERRLRVWALFPGGIFAMFMVDLGVRFLSAGHTWLFAALILLAIAAVIAGALEAARIDFALWRLSRSDEHAVSFARREG